MKELDENKVYLLDDLTSEELEELLNWLKENDEYWEETELEDFKNVLGDITLKFYNNEWNWSKENATTNAKELFYTLENIQVDCSKLTQYQIDCMKEVVIQKGYTLWNYKTAFRLYDKVCYLVKNETDNDFLLSTFSDNKTTITYDKFMELFSNKEENFKKLVEVLNEELTEKVNLEFNPISENKLFQAYKETEYEVKYIAEKPKQYQIGIDTFERCEANMTKEEILACVRFNIDKYIWRNKGQDLEDLEKIISYANWGIKQLKK